MEYTKDFFEKVFSSDRMKKYFCLYPQDYAKAIMHYQCNIMLSEAMYPSLSVFTNRGEEITTAKITAELTWGFWTSLFNRDYERILWKDLRRAFPFVRKANRQRKVVASCLNKFRHLRNRIDHNEAICWSIEEVELIHREMQHVMGWMNKDVPAWLATFDRFDQVCQGIRRTLA